MRDARLALGLIVGLTASACTRGGVGPSGAAGSSGGAGTGSMAGAGATVSLALSAADMTEVSRVSALLAPTKALTASALAAQHIVPFAPTLPYDPMKAVNLAQLQASHEALGPEELAVLAKNGFVISDKQHYPGFFYGYTSIYADDLPVYVSADSILHAVHRSYDDILKTVESARLLSTLTAILDAMRTRLAAGSDGLAAATVKDVDLYLAVARALLTGDAPSVVAGGDAAQAGTFVTKAIAAAGAEDAMLFGQRAHFDFSQFKPRGHYVGDERLERYFRAMMWLGRTELPVIAVDEGTGATRFVRRALDAAVALRRLMDAASFDAWKTIDATLRAFVGEPDSMSPPDVDRLLADLGVADPTALAAVSDATIAQKIIDGGYGQQSISSQIIINGTGGTLPLARSFLFLGQRYVVDSHVFSNVVFDRVNHPPAPARMLPNPLDVAYAALGNDQAVSLLADDLATHAYAPDLEAMRVLVGQYDGGFWGANLYNGWLGALRALSPAAADLASPGSGLPSVARSEAWGRRVLNAQLASWAELRHDTLLYAKQSYSGGIACEFPDAYVEPYPAFFAALESYAAKGTTVAAMLADGTSSTMDAVSAYFQHLGDVSRILREMAEHQRTGTPHTAEHLAFINEIVAVQTVGCGSKIAAGWYPRLFFTRDAALVSDPTIADVHTAPTDDAGNSVGNVLHVATGYPRLMVVTVDTCTGPRAYAGLASGYHEKVTTDYVREADQEWAMEQASAPDVVWMKDLIVR